MKKKNNVFILILILTTLAVLLFGWYFLSRLEKEKKPQANFGFGPLPEPSFSFYLSNFQNYQFLLPSSFKNLPAVIEVFKIETKETNEKQIEKILNVFNISEFPKKITPNIKTLPFDFYYETSSKNYLLRIYPDGSFIYKYIISDFEEFKNFPFFWAEEDILALIKEKINKLGIEENQKISFSFQKKYFSITKTQYSFVEEKEKTDGILIQLFPKIDNYLIISKNDPNSPFIEVKIGNNGQILSFFSSPMFSLKSSLSATYPLKSLSFAQKEIKENKGKIIYLKDIPFYPEANQQIILKNVFLNNLELVYFLDKKNNLLYPLFLFKGKALLENNQETEIIIALPAIISSPTPVP